MGGCCCCSSKGVELNSSPPVYLYPRLLEEREPLPSHHHTVSTLSRGLLVDTNLETSILDTYRPPPRPMPYDTNLGRVQSPPASRESCGNKSDEAIETQNIESVGEANRGNSLETSDIDLKDSNCRVQTEIELVSLKELLKDELEKSGELKKSSEPLVSAPEEEDVCPTCLEEYDTENPKIVTKCEHHFHLSCILEWMERSDTCPVCDQEMIFNLSYDS